METLGVENSSSSQPLKRTARKLPDHLRKTDIISETNGDFGRWQLRTIILIFLCKIPTSWFMACIIYTAPAPKLGNYYCKPPKEISDNNMTKKWIELASPNIRERQTDREFNVDFCNAYEHLLDEKFTYLNYSNPFRTPLNNSNISSKQIIPCNQFEDKSEYISLVTEFDLICSRQILIGVSQGFHSFGSFIGGLVAVKLLEYISPRRLMLIGMILQILSGNITGLVRAFELHIFFRCLTSAFCAFMYTSGQMIFSDITGGTAKTIVITLFELFWSIGLIILPGIYLFVDSWTYLYIAISSPTIILVFLHRWISDSPRWHLKKGNTDETLRILLESATFNNKEIPLDLENELEIYHNELKSLKISNYWAIWDGETNHKYIISVHFAWIFSVMLYNAMILNIRAFGVDHLHINTVILGLAEMLGVLIGLYFILYSRNRWRWIGFLIIAAGLLAFFIWLVPTNWKESRRVGMGMIFCVGLKLANSAALSILTTCTSEIVSTEKRSKLMFSVVTSSRISFFISSFIAATTVFHSLLPITIFAFLAIINGFLMVYINRQFWNRKQPIIPRVPTLKVYKKNSRIILSRRNSICINERQLNENFSELRKTASISDIWMAVSENKM